MRFVQRHHVVDQIPPGSSQPIALRRCFAKGFQGSPDRLETHRTDGDLRFKTVSAVTIEDQVLKRRLKRERFPQL